MKLSSFSGNCVFESRDIGVLSLVPHSGSRLALVVTGTSLSSIHDVMHLATPTIPPMARSPFSNLVPDYVLTGPDFKAHGPGGYLCAGFWGNHWEYRSDTSSCSCWRLTKPLIVKGNWMWPVSSKSRLNLEQDRKTKLNWIEDFKEFRQDFDLSRLFIEPK